MSQNNCDFFFCLPAELLLKIFAYSKLPDVLSLLIALGSSNNIANNSIKVLLPEAIKMSPMEIGYIGSKTTLQESYGMLDLAMKEKCGKEYLECDEKCVLSLAELILQHGSIGKYIFGEGKYITYRNLDSASKYLVQKSLCNGIVSIDDGLFDVSKEVDKEAIQDSIFPDTIEIIMEGVEVIYQGANLLEAIEEQDFDKAKMAIDKGSDLTELNNWYFKSYKEYKDIRETLQIISYMNSKNCNAKVRIDAKNIIKAAEYGDFDILKLLYNHSAICIKISKIKHMKLL